MDERENLYLLEATSLIILNFDWGGGGGGGGGVVKRVKECERP
jgi:hypothetical protein